MTFDDATQIVPNLTTTLTGPLLSLEKTFLNRQVEIETWLRKAWQVTPAPIQCSVDLRNAGFKLAPVDTNVFPAGFNNLSYDSIPLCIQALQATFAKQFPGCEKILLIPENHTRNIFYLENVATLVEILNKAGYQVKVGSLIPDIESSKDIGLPSGRTLQLHQILRNNHKLYVENFMPCMILLNNDLSDGLPEILTGLQQLIQPSLKLGWSNRTKSTHFKFYSQVASEFANEIDIDPWLINPLFSTVENVDFNHKPDLEIIAEQAQQILQKNC